MSEKFNGQVNLYSNHNSLYQSSPYNSDLKYFLPVDYCQNNQRVIIDYGSVGCAVDRPCIRGIYKSGPNLIIEWSDVEHRDRYNFRWSRPGIQERQLEVAGGHGGQFILRNFHYNTIYTFKVQGCTTHFLSSSTCTHWDVAQYRT